MVSEFSDVPSDYRVKVFSHRCDDVEAINEDGDGGIQGDGMEGHQRGAKFCSVYRGPT